MTVPGRPGGGDPHRWAIAFAVVLASVIQVIDTSIVNVAIPHMMGTLGATIDEIAWVSTGYMLAAVIVIPLTGWLASFFGRKRYFAGSIVLFTAASFFCGASHSLTALIVWRVIQGIGGGALVSTSQAILYEAFPRDETAKAMAMWGVGIMVGPTLGPTLGGWITDNYSWPWIFYINLPIGALAAAMVVAYVHDRADSVRTRSVDGIGIALLAISVASFQWVIEHGQREEWFTSETVVTLTVLAGVTGILLIWRELTIPEPAVDFRVLRHRQVWAGTLMGVVVGIGLFGSVFVLPIFLQGVLRMTAWQTGVIILPGALATAVSMAFVGRIGNRIDPRLLIATGGLMFVAGMVMLSQMTSQTGTGDFFWPLIWRGLGLGLVFVPLTNLTLADLDYRELPHATGVSNFFRQLGGSFGIAGMASLLTRFTAEARVGLAAGLPSYGPVTDGRLAVLTHAFMARGADGWTAQQRAMAVLNGQLGIQASVIGFSKVYLLSGVILLASLPLLFLLRPGQTRHAGPAVME
jgi:DHA2 family multidrug resistance protein